MRYAKGGHRELYMDDGIADKHIEIEIASTSEKNRDRHETRICSKAPDISWLACKDERAGLRNVYAVYRRTVVSEQVSEETSYYITSLDVPCAEILRIVREHWKIESMHRKLDVVFSEDDCRILSANGQKSMNVFRKLALSLHKSYITGLEQKTKPCTKKICSAAS
jgi:predicted transposase YbfD/YdcC